MKFLQSFPALLALLFAFPAAGLEAIPSYRVASAFGGYAPGGAGFAFTPQTNMAITALGFNGTGITNGPYVVTLWANNGPLVSVQVTVGNAFLNQTFYAPIPALQLIRGQTYYLSAAGTNNYWVGNLIQTNIPPQSFTISPDILYLGSAYGTNSTGDFPAGTGDTISYYVAPNFQYQIGGGTNLIWAATANNQWDIATSFNWRNSANGQSDRFFNGESVVFDDTAGVVTNIVILGGVSVMPTVVTNNSSTNAFTFSGAGKISGQAMLVKDGTSPLTIATSNDFTGATLLLGGTLKIGNSGALGSTNGATLITNSATLDLNGFNIGAEQVIISGTGVSNAGAIVNNNGPGLSNPIKRLRLAGNASIGGTSYWDLESGASILTAGQAFNLTKVGTNEFRFFGVTSIDPALADIDVQQGTFSVHLANPPLGNPARTVIVRTNATFTVRSLGQPLNKKLSLHDGSTVSNNGGQNVLAGTVSLDGTNKVLSAGDSVSTLTFSNVLSGSGSILIARGPGTVILTATNTFTGSTLVSDGIVALIGGGSISSNALISIASGASLDVTARTDARLTLAKGQTLAGNGNILGSVTASSGSTISPGSGIGVLTVSNDVVLLGTNFMELSKTSATNDMLLVGGTLSYGGTLSLTNTSGTLAAGDRFQLFSAAVFTNSFTGILPGTAGPGLSWDLSQLTINGSIGVVRSQPFITNIAWFGTNVIIGGTNGFPTNNYYVLTTTNLSVPLTNWSVLVTNLFNPAGNFIFTNAVNPAVAELFYLLQIP